MTYVDLRSVTLDYILRRLISLFTLLWLALAAITYQYYAHWRSEQQTSTPVPYIPADAALVYEVADVRKQWKQLQQTPVVQAFGSLPPFESLQQKITWLKREFLDNHQALEKVPLVLSVHRPTKKSVEYLFYLNTHDIPTQHFLKATMAKIKQNKTCTINTRKYANTQITLLSNHGGSCQLAYVQCGHYVIVSLSASPIKRIIDILAGKKQGQFLSLKKSKNQGGLYINLGQLAKVICPLLHTAKADALNKELARLGQYGQFNCGLTSHHLLLNGVVHAPAKKSKYLTSTLVGQNAAKLQLADYLPEAVAFMKHVTFNNPKRFLAAWQCHSAKPTVQKNTVTPFNAATARLMKGEISHCIMPLKREKTPQELVFVRVKNVDAFIKVLDGNQLLTPAIISNANLPNKTYRLQSNCLRETLVGHTFPGFNPVYLTHIDSCIVLSSHQGALRDWHRYYQRGATWSKDLTKKSWLDSTLDQAHFTEFVDLPAAWRSILQALKPQWQQILSKHTPPPVNISLQLLRSVDHNCHMNVLVQHKAQKLPPANIASPAARLRPTSTEEMLPAETCFQANAPLIHAPWLVKSHLGKGQYMLLQDAQYQLYLLNPAGKLLWKKKLEGPITTEVFEVDFYKSNKTQYLFATDEKLYLIDYYGRRVGPYPQTLPAPAQLQVIDYERNSNYRFLLTTAQGAIYLKDKHYNTLSGWNPRNLGHACIRSPFHFKDRGKDYFLALQNNGILHALKRKGPHYTNFPVDLRLAVNNPLVVRQTNNSTVLTAITGQGQCIDVGMTGRIENKVQLGCAANTKRFIVYPDQNDAHDQFVVARQDADKVVMLNSTMKPLFEVPYTKKALNLQYYYLGKERRYYVFNDPEEGTNYLFDAAGNPLNLHGLKSDHKVQLSYSPVQKRLTVYGCVGKKLLKYVFDR